MLEPEEEYMLAKAWVERQDSGAAHKLVTSHLRLAAKIAMGYRGYGLPQAEVISEANVGLMQAVKKFDRKKVSAWPHMRCGGSGRAFRNMCCALGPWLKWEPPPDKRSCFSIFARLNRGLVLMMMGTLRPEQVARIATDLGVTETEVQSMNRRMSGGDASLNVMVGSDGESATQWQDWLQDEDADQAGDYERNDEMSVRRDMLAEAMGVLNDREKDIIAQRRLHDQPVTLEELSSQYSVSRERIRQIEVRAFEKLQNRMRELAQEKGLLRDQ